MVDKRISALPVALPATANDLLPTSQGSVSPNTGITRKITFANASFGIGVGFNVMSFGATGDGVTDDGPAFQLALNAVPVGGGVVLIPPAPSGTYLIGQCLRQKSYTIIKGSGAGGVLKASATFTNSPDYGGSAMFLNVNSQSNETSFSGYRDFEISFENVWFDNSLRLAGDAHAIMHRAVKTVSITNCYFLDGGDATACVTCDDHLVDGCTAIGQTNCTYDHWGGSTNCRVVNSYGEVGATSTGQVINFNGIRTGVGAGVNEVWNSDGFVLTGCEIICTDTQRSINFEPLGPNSTVKNVTVANNKIRNARVIMGNATENVVLTNNVFYDTNGNTSPIWARTQFAADANMISVLGNQFENCSAPAGGAIIDSTAPNTIVIGNIVNGGSYEYGVRFRNGVIGTFLGNKIPNASLFEVLGSYGAGGDVQVESERRLSMLDSDGYSAFWSIDATKTLFLTGSSASLGLRAIMSIAMQSSTSTLVLYPNTAIVGFFRQSTGAALTALGTTRLDAYAIITNICEFTTVAVGTGAILPGNVVGSSVVIWNAGANTLNVYPPAAGEIDALGTNNPDTIAAGASKRYTAITSIQYRIAP